MTKPDFWKKNVGAQIWAQKDQNEPKIRFLAFYLCQVCWIDLLLPKVIQLNLPQHLAMLLGHEGSFKSHTKVFLNDQKSQKGVFWPLSGVWMVGTTWYFLLWLSKSFLPLGDVNRSCIVNEPCIISITHAKRGKNEVKDDEIDQNDQVGQDD